MTVAQERLGFFNARLEQRADERGVSVRELALKVGTSYEHMRKLIGGSCLPSEAVLGRLCSVLELSQKEMALRVKKDRVVFRFGDMAWEACGLNPRAAPLYILWPLLTGRTAALFTHLRESRRSGKSSRYGPS